MSDNTDKPKNSSTNKSNKKKRTPARDIIDSIALHQIDISKICDVGEYDPDDLSSPYRVVPEEISLGNDRRKSKLESGSTFSNNCLDLIGFPVRLIGNDGKNYGFFMKNPIQLFIDNLIMKYLKKITEYEKDESLTTETRDTIIDLYKHMIERAEQAESQYRSSPLSRSLSHPEYEAFKIIYSLGAYEMKVAFSKYLDKIEVAESLGAREDKDAKKWADKLEQHYLSELSNMSDKHKKANCYRHVEKEYEAETKKALYSGAKNSNKLRSWWKRYYPQRFSNTKK